MGTGLTIQPNAVLALRRLGLGEPVERAGAALRVGGLLRWDGSVIAALPHDAGESMLKEAGAPILGIHRATLQELLLEALGRDALHLDHVCVGYEVSGDSVRVRFADGSETSCAALVGADDITDRRPLARWGEGPVTLLGDAAHPMTPNLGQGACQAIEDAFVLREMLTTASSLPVGLRAYEAARRKRANSMVVAARRLGAVAQWENPLACSVRNALFSSMPSGLMKRQMLASWQLPYA